MEMTLNWVRVIRLAFEIRKQYLEPVSDGDALLVLEILEAEPNLGSDREPWSAE